ncbi:MAG: LEA type 2 family protein [Flavobacteriia bacterium]|jgi:LEA14-like dessication related protein
MTKLIYFLVVTLFLVSCEFKDIDFEGVEDYKLEKFENNEAHINLKLKVSNENWFGIKVKPSKLNVTADGKEMGTLFLDKRVKIKGKRSNAYETKIRFKLADGAMFSAAAMMLKPSVNLTFEGKVKGGVFIFTKKIDIKQTKTINPKDFKLF